MDFFEVIKARYSHKEKFLSTPVPLQDLERIAEAGIAAPTGANRQSVRLIILPDRAIIASLYDIFPTDGLLTAPAAIAVLTDNFSQNSKNNFAMEDYAATTENMLLAAVALGYASLWLDCPFFSGENQKAALTLLDVPAGHYLHAVLPIGKPDGPGSRREKMSFHERVSYRRFGEGKDEGGKRE